MSAVGSRGMVAVVMLGVGVLQADRMTDTQKANKKFRWLIFLWRFCIDRFMDFPCSILSGCKSFLE